MWHEWNIFFTSSMKYIVWLMSLGSYHTLSSCVYDGVCLYTDLGDGGHHFLFDIYTFRNSWFVCHMKFLITAKFKTWFWYPSLMTLFSRFRLWISSLVVILSLGLQGNNRQFFVLVWRPNTRRLLMALAELIWIQVLLHELEIS